jgi:hypothetical protein
VYLPAYSRPGHSPPRVQPGRYIPRAKPRWARQCHRPARDRASGTTRLHSCTRDALASAERASALQRRGKRGVSDRVRVRTAPFDGAGTDGEAVASSRRRPRATLARNPGEAVEGGPATTSKTQGWGRNPIRAAKPFRWPPPPMPAPCLEGLQPLNHFRPGSRLLPEQEVTTISSRLPEPDRLRAGGQW